MLLHEVLLAGGGGNHALAAPALRAIGGLRQALDIAIVRHGNDHVLFLDQIQHVDLAVKRGDFRAALVGKLRA